MCQEHSKGHRIHKITITHITGHEEQMGLKFTTRVGGFIVDEIEKIKIEKIKIESVVDDEDVDKVIATIKPEFVTCTQ